MCIVVESAGGSVAVAVGVSDMWEVTCDIWHLITDTWHLTPDERHFFVSVLLQGVPKKVSISTTNSGTNRHFFVVRPVHTLPDLVSPECGISNRRRKNRKKVQECLLFGCGGRFSPQNREVAHCIGLFLGFLNFSYLHVLLTVCKSQNHILASNSWFEQLFGSIPGIGKNCHFCNFFSFNKNIFLKEIKKLNYSLFEEEGGEVL